jgi:hypothetical protein
LQRTLPSPRHHRSPAKWLGRLAPLGGNLEGGAQSSTSLEKANGEGAPRQEAR